MSEASSGAEGLFGARMDQIEAIGVDGCQSRQGKNRMNPGLFPIHCSDRSFRFWGE